MVTDVLEYNPAEELENDSGDMEVILPPDTGDEAESDPIDKVVNEFNPAAIADQEESEQEKYAFKIKDELGEREVLLSPDELQEAVQNAYKKRQYDEQFEKLAPFIEQVKESPLLQSVVRYMSQGYNEGEIIDGLYALRHPEVMNGYGQATYQQPPQPQQNGVEQEESEPEYFETLGDEIKYHVRKAIQEVLPPLQQELEQLKSYTVQQLQEKQYNAIVNNNDRAFAEAASSIGLDINNFNSSDYDRLASVIKTLYPNVDMTRYQFTPQQAENIMRLAFGDKLNKKSVTRQLVKAVKLPRVMPGRLSSSSSVMKSPSQLLSEIKTDRSEAVDKFFGW